MGNRGVTTAISGVSGPFAEEAAEELLVLLLHGLDAEMLLRPAGGRRSLRGQIAFHGAAHGPRQARGVPRRAVPGDGILGGHFRHPADPVETIGSPAAMASRITSGRPSLMEESTNTSMD